MNSKFRAALIAVIAFALMAFGAVAPASAAGISGQVTLDGIAYGPVEVHVFQEGAAPISFTTNADGTWSLGGATPGNYTFSVFADDQLHQGFVSPVQALTEATPLVLTLPLLSWPTGTSAFTGQIRDATTLAGLAGATVTFDGNGQAADQLPAVDGSGHFVVDGLPAGTYNFFIGAPGYVTKHVSYAIGDGATSAVIFDLVPADSAISVHVQSAEGVLDLGLFWTATLDVDPTVTVNGPETDVLGNSSQTGVGAGTYTVRVGGPGTGWIEQTKPAVAPSGGTVLVSFVLEVEPAGGIGGIVRSSASTGIGDICVDIIDVATGDAVASLTPTTTLSDGTYSATGIPIGTYTTMYWDCDYSRDPAWETRFYGGSTSLAHATAFPITLDATTTLTDVTLGLGGTISGHLNVQASDGVVEFPSGRGSGLGVTIFQLVDGAWLEFPSPSPFVGGPNPGDYDFRGLPTGTYRAGWFDPLTGPRSYADEYWNNQATLAAATDIPVVGGSTVIADVTLAVERPSGVPDPVATDDLAASDEGEITTLSFATAGTDLEIEIDEDFAGEWMAAFGHSVPQLFGDWALVSSTGSITVPIPVDLPAGIHTLVVQNAEGLVMGWTTISIAAAPVDPTKPLALTGAGAALWIVPVGGVAVTLGLALFLMFRRRDEDVAETISE